MTDTSNAQQSLMLELKEKAESGTPEELQALIAQLSPADLARVLESSPSKRRAHLWGLIDDELQGQVIHHINSKIVPELIVNEPAADIARLLKKVGFDDDQADVLQHLPPGLAAEVLLEIDAQDRTRVESLLDYPEHSAGGMMGTDIIAIQPNINLETATQYLRFHAPLPPTTDRIFVVNNQDEYLGVLPLTTLLVSDPALSVREVMLTDTISLPADMSSHDVAERFKRYDLVSAPVIDANQRLVGRITVDDVVDVIVDEADHSLMSMAGLDTEDDVFSPIIPTARRRAFWLGANLLTAFIAASVIDLFTDTIEKVVALAVLMPIVASMGGVAGSQTLTLVIRSMAQDELFETNLMWLLRRELAVGALNGVLWAVVVAVAASLVFNDIMIGYIIASALIINLVVAALSGALLPSALKALGIDPAIAGTVVLTTITDVTGFMAFLGLATIVYG
ncbi:MAG: magnesium transporter [Pseudomonadales bacterium]